MHLQNFGLNSEPFGAAFEPDFFYRGYQHGAALSFLEQAFAIDRPALALIGPQGAGKSSSLQFAVERRSGGTRLGQIDGLPETAAAFLNSVLEAFGFGALEAGRAELRNLLSVFVVQSRQNEQHVVLQVRDPHLPTPEVMDEILWLLHAVAADGGFQVVFSGGEGLEALLATPRLATLAGLFRDRHQLAPLGERETLDYLHFRLGAAGIADPEPMLPEDACRAIFEATGGIVRVVNRLAAAALERAGRAGADSIDVAAVRDSAAPLGLNAGGEVGESGFRLDVHLDETPYMQLPLGRRKILIGRHSHNEINLRDGSVSRHHAMVVPEGDRWVIVDLNSTNGTLVNGESVKHYPLTDGDSILVGRFRIEFRGHTGSSRARHEEPDLRKTVVLSDR